MKRGERRKITNGPRSGTITKLAVRSGRPDRTALHLDGHPAGDLGTEVVERTGLAKGDVLSEDDLQALLDRDEPYRARARALRLLAARDRSTAEMESRLLVDGFTPDTVRATVGWLAGLGYVDDTRFAERYVAEKARAGWGGRRIRSELLRKGLDRSVLDAALALGDDDETVAAREESLLALVQRRFGRQWREDRQTAERRLAGYLARRGYDWDDVARVIRRLEEAPGHEAEEPPHSRTS